MNRNDIYCKAQTRGTGISYTQATLQTVHRRHPAASSQGTFSSFLGPGKPGQWFDVTMGKFARLALQPVSTGACAGG